MKLKLAILACGAIVGFISTALARQPTITLDAIGLVFTGAGLVFMLLYMATRERL